MPHNIPDNQNIPKVSPTESLMSTDTMHPRPFDTCQRISSHDATAWHEHVYPNPVVSQCFFEAIAQFIGVCSNANTYKIGEHILSVSGPISRPQERLIHAGALIHPRTLQRQPVSRLHSYTAVERAPAAMSPVPEPRR